MRTDLEPRSWFTWNGGLFPCFFFATTAVIPGGDDGVAGGAGGGGDESGDESGDVGGGEETTEDDGEEAADTEDGEAADDEGDEDDTETGGDEEDEEASSAKAARQTTEAVKKALDKLRATDPEAAKVLRKEFFSKDQKLNQFRESFPTPQRALEARELIDGVMAIDSDGNRIVGTRAVKMVQDEAQKYASELSSLSQGDTRIVDELARDFPKGLLKLAPYATAKLKNLDSAVYAQRVAAPATVDVLNMTAGSLNGSTPIHAIDRVIELISDGKQKEAHALAQSLRQWTSDVTAYARQTKTARTDGAGGEEDDDPARQEIEQGRADLAKQRQNMFATEVSGVIMKRLSRVVDQYLAPYLKKAKLTPKQRTGTHNGIRNRITAALQRDSHYQARFKQLLEGGDSAAVGKFVAKQANRRAKRAVSDEWEERGYGARRTGGGAGGSDKNANVIRMDRKPGADEIDWSKDRDRKRYMTGEATLKNGKTAKWDWDKV